MKKPAKKGKKVADEEDDEPPKDSDHDPLASDMDDDDNGEDDGTIFGDGAVPKDLKPVSKETSYSCYCCQEEARQEYQVQGLGFQS